MKWLRVSATDPHARRLADRHYPRENVGAKFFTPPGRKVVLRTFAGDAYWVTLSQQYVDHAWPGAWLCSAFRNESTSRSSDLIREALAATCAEWGPPPSEGCVTFVDPTATRRRRSRAALPGHCFRACGFVEVGTTGRGYVALRLDPENFPKPVPAWSRQMSLDDVITRALGVLGEVTS